MKTMSKSNLPRGLMLVGFFILLTCTAQAQINFVQITDPHIFDDIKEEDGSRLNDKAALASFVDDLNQRVAEKVAQKTSAYAFVVVTGDLGLEQLLKGVKEDDRKYKLETAAVELASIIGLSKVGTWLFVPGNNDLLDEVPANVKYYHQFIEALSEAVQGAENKITIVDLCAPEKKPFQLGEYGFIGFNDASFKNQDGDATAGRVVRIWENFAEQVTNVAEVSRQLEAKEIRFAYIFYHIPEIDDPYSVTLKDDHESLKPRFANTGLTGGPYIHSAWFVKSAVREEWNKIVVNPKVMGLFAGHFHDNKKSTYESFQWLRTRHYLSDTMAKLHVAPPLALKKQKGKDEQARGFQEVHIDGNGKVSARIFWLGQTGWSLNTQQAAIESAARKQLELGRTYEDLGRLKEAEAAYVKAAESDWTPTRQMAIDSLKQVSQRQDAVTAKQVAAPLVAAWSAGVTAASTALITALLTVAGLALIWVLTRPFAPWWRSYWKRKGRNKVKIGPITHSPKDIAGPRFEQLLMLVHGRLRTHFKPRKLIKGVPRLPMIARSQSAEVLELVESLIPGAVGKYIGWLLKESNKPQYSIEAVVQSRWNLRWFLVSVKDDGELLKNWNEMSDNGNWIAEEKKLAFNAMKRVVRHMHK